MSLEKGFIWVNDTEAGAVVIFRAVAMALFFSLLSVASFAQDEKCFVWGEDTEAGASVHTECSLVYTKDTDKLFKSDGTTLTEIAAGGAGGSDSFVTIATSTGSSPIADSDTDTLTLTCTAPLVCTGDSTADSVTFSLTGLILDLGDDGGNDSTALTELSTVNDDYSVITEPSADEAQIDFAKIPPYQQYDPDRPPSSCATCDEFTGGFQQTWTWANQGSATDVVENGMAKITGPGAVGVRVFRALPAPTAGTDFTVTAKIYPGYGFSYSSTDFNSLWVLDTGTLAAPTKFYEIGIAPQAHYTTQMYVQTMTGFNTWSSTQLSFQPQGAQSGMYLQWRYVAAAKDLYVYFSINGRIWTFGASYTMTNHPSYVGRSNTNGTNPAYWEFFRIRTDANRNLAGE